MSARRAIRSPSCQRAGGLVKHFGRVIALDRCRFRPDAGRDPGRDRRQRRRQVDADQGADRRRHARCAARSCSTASAVHFRSPIEARAAGIETVYQNLALCAGAVDRRQPVPRPRAAQGRACSARCFRSLDRAAMRARGARAPERARPAHDPEHPPAGRDALRRPAPGRGRGARDRVRQPRRRSWTSRPRRSASRNRGRCSS